MKIRTIYIALFLVALIGFLDFGYSQVTEKINQPEKSSIGDVGQFYLGAKSCSDAWEIGRKLYSNKQIHEMLSPLVTKHKVKLLAVYADPDLKVGELYEFLFLLAEAGIEKVILAGGLSANINLIADENERPLQKTDLEALIKKLIESATNPPTDK